MKSKNRFTLIFLLLIAAQLPLLRAQPPLARAQSSKDLQVEADQLNYEAENNLVTARGNVLLRKGAQSLKADVITYNRITEQAFARGNVVFTNEDQIWRGETLQYNFITGKGSFPNLGGTVGPFKIKADRVERMGPVQTNLQTVEVTTCADTQDPDFMIRSGSVDVYEDEIYVMHNPVFHLHGIPFFWVPRLTLDPQRAPTNIDVIPGYSSRNGAMLLTAYSRYPRDGYRTKTILDYRTERGFAAGQNFYWYNPENISELTTLQFYGALDDAPYRDQAQEDEYLSRGIEVEEERYRVKFSTRKEITPTNTFWAKASYLSDAKVVEDFFVDEFRDEPVPETRFAYSAVGQGWNANADLTRQLNEDEFGSVNRIPEASFNVPLLQMGDLELLYESETKAGYLEKTFSAFDRDNGKENYESARFHTDQKFYYPTKSFGWLNIIPRAGGSLTYYSDTNKTETQITPVSTVDENNIITTSFETNTVASAGSSDVRILPEIGFETSFKAFGIVHDQPTALGDGLRHVVEPFANYTFIPEPDLTPAEIYQFDDIDRLGERHDIAFGIRNKWQTKRRLGDGRHQIHDLVNMSLSTRYDLRSDADPALGNWLLDTELKLADWVWTRFDVTYNSDEGEFSEANMELRLEDPNSKSRLTLNQRYRLDQTNTSQLDYEISPLGRTGISGYTRYDFESEGFEEQQIMFTIRTECLGYGIGGKWRQGNTYADGSSEEDDYEIFFQLWLSAFPRAIMGTGRR